MKNFILFSVVAALCLMSGKVDAQSLSVRADIPYSATTTFNFSVQPRLDSLHTLDLFAGYNPWTFRGNRKFKHILLQPELRRWFDAPYTGHFVAIHAHYSIFNVGGFPPIRHYRYEGWLIGAGIGYGYDFRLNDRLKLELEIGAGYAYIDYDKFPCERCSDMIRSAHRHYFGPTKLSASIVYTIGENGRTERRPQIYLP